MGKLRYGVTGLKKALVMGGTEFVGMAILKGLITKGYQVDFLTRGIKKVFIQGYNKHYICDRKNENELKKCLSGIEYDYIFDISAYSRRDVEVLLKSVKLSRITRYCFLSSGAVYTLSKNYLYENSERGTNPNWGMYGLDKKEAEDYLFNLSKSNGFPMVIFRPSYIYGEGNNLYRESYFFHRILNNQPIPIPNTGKKTQFIHIKDIVDIILDSITNDKTVGEAYNLTHPSELEWIEFVETIQKIVSKQTTILSVSQEDMNNLNITSRQFFPFRDITYLMDINKLKEHNLILPRINIEEGLQASFDWFLQQNVKEQFDCMKELRRVTNYYLQKNDFL
ncbi:MAG: RNA-binding protein [Neobacillus sp.]|jgi:nucleoside-diphosphate-sugar epimerase|nr:RNA-binding protein [Neobacillus sp.]